METLGAHRIDRLRRHSITAALLLATAALLAPRTAAADEKPTLSGSWTASSLTEAWSVTDWGPACGAKPTPQGAGGGAVQIREQGGELSIIGAGRAFTTAECWEQMPGLARTSHSQSGGGRSWRTRCSTPANDPRKATVVTTITATDTTISLNETGQYESQPTKDATCKASVTRSRSFSLVRRDGETPPAASASASASAAPSAAPSASAAAKAPPEPRPSRCTGPAGDPARLEVNPSKKLLRPGDRFAFRAVVLDESGCPTGAKATWALAPGALSAKATVDGSGAVTVASDAGEGKIELTATALGKSVTVSIEVARPEAYDALLEARGLNDAGEQDEAAVAMIATGTIGGRTSVGEDLARERKLIFVTIVVGLAAALGLVGLILTRRGRRTEPELAGPPEEEGGEAQEEQEPLPPGNDGGAEAPPPPPAGPTGAPNPPAKPKKSVERGKICPTCGDRYGAEATFCGKDATKLVLLN